MLLNSATHYLPIVTSMFSLSIHQMQITCTHIFYHSIKMHTSPAQHPHFTRDLRNWRTFCARVAPGFTTLACCRHEFPAGQDTGKKLSMYCSLARSTGISCQRVDCDTSKWPFTVSRGRSTFRARGLPATPQKVHSTKKSKNRSALCCCLSRRFLHCMHAPAFAKL